MVNRELSVSAPLREITRAWNLNLQHFAFCPEPFGFPASSPC